MFTKDLFSEFKFEKFSNTDTIADSVKLDYIKEMISLARNDKQAVFLYFGFNLAAIAFLFDKIEVAVKSFGIWPLSIFYIGILCLIVSTVFFFTYWRKIHHYQMDIISCIPTLNIVRVRDLWIELWNINKRYFKYGLYLMASGIFILVAIMFISKLAI